jgi:hypothetical protein
LRNIQWVTQNYSNALSLSADAGWTQQNYSQSDPLSGNSIASFLLGTPSGGSSAYALLGIYRYGYYAPWVQDDWRVSKRLTINLGLRWDDYAAVERFNRMNRGFTRRGHAGEPDCQRDRGLLRGVNGQPPPPMYRRPSSRDRLRIKSGEAGMRGGWGRTLNPSNGYIQSTAAPPRP